MAVKYESVVPWGRSFDEYVSMFALSDADLGARILGCGDGPAAFNHGMKERGGRAVSLDPIYRMDKAAIRRRIDETCADVLDQTRRHTEQFRWDRIRDLDALRDLRLGTMADFLEDFEAGKRQGRYVAGGVPDLPFADGAFDICLSSHFLFLYTDNLTLDFHFQAIDAMLRVAGEARIFPLLDINSRHSPYVDAVLRRYRDSGRDVAEVPVDYEFQIGGNAMLRIR
ncbi:hypothetical protein [Solidesulfovibrio sp. C21]|uniref:hypothetical protein n=1 Tax=Solidesulfovibrio sp. C21 TaxID=3398613 RepID=UPI0039FCAE9D